MWVSEYGCYLLQDNNCDFFCWHDAKFDERPNTVINELLDDIDCLYDENVMLRRGGHGRVLGEEIDAILQDVKKLKRQARLNDGEMRKWKKQCGAMKAMLFCSWLVFIVYWCAMHVF